MIGLLAQCLGLGAICAFEKHYYSKEQVYKRHPEILERNRRMREAERKRNLETVEVMKRVGVIIDPNTGIDQTGKKWWTECIVWKD